MKVLIGYDHSPCSDDAVMGLQQAGLPQTTELLILTVSDLWPLVPLLEEEERLTAYAGYSGQGRPELGSRGHDIPVWVPDTIKQARERALQHLEELRAETLPVVQRLEDLHLGWAVSLEAIADSPYWALIEKADKWGADLIVVGSHGRGAIGRVMLGSVSLNVTMHTHCSVRISRPSLGRQVEPLRLVLGFDASPDSEAALEAVCARSWPAGTVVRLVSVGEPNAAALLPLYLMGGAEPFGFHMTYPEAPPNYCSWMESACEAAAVRLRQTGLQVDISMPDGDPKQVLLDEAQQWGADCIFVGAKGQRGGRPRSLGAVATAIATRAHCSVEVTRKPVRITTD